MMRRLLIILMCTVPLLAGGCTPIDLQSLRTQAPGGSGTPLEMAVVADRQIVQQDKQEIPGVVAQVIFLDEAGAAVEFDGEITLAFFSEDGTGSKDVQPNKQWQFRAAEVKKSVTQGPLGTVHKFWLPLHGPISDAKKIKLLTLATAADGRHLTQWNKLTSTPPSMKIEQTTDEAPKNSTNSAPLNTTAQTERSGTDK